MKIRPSKKLYDILKETFESKYREGYDPHPHEQDKFYQLLEELGAHVQILDSGDGVPYLIENIMNLVEEGWCDPFTGNNPQPDQQYVVCPDPGNHDSNKFFRALFFPKELAEKVMILGGLPI